MDGIVVAGIAICVVLAAGLATAFLVARTRRKVQARGQGKGYPTAIIPRIPNKATKRKAKP